MARKLRGEEKEREREMEGADVTPILVR